MDLSFHSSKAFSKASSSHSPRTRFIVVAIVAMLAIQLFAVLVSGVSARDASLESSTRSLDTEGDITIARILRFLDPAERVVNDTVELLDREVVAADGTDLEEYLYTRLSSLEHISAINVGFADGSFVSVATDLATDAAYSSSRVTVDSERFVRTTNYDDDFEVIGTWTSDDADFDATERPWYTDAADSESLTWTDPYVFFGSEQPGVTASRALVADGEVVAVVGVDVQLVGLGAFLDDLDAAEHHQAFVIADGVVIGAPKERELMYDTETDGSLALSTPEQMGLARPNGTGEAVKRTSTPEGRDLVLLRDFPQDQGLDWQLLVRAPESEANTVVTGLQYTTLKIMLGGGILVVVALIVLLRISRPIDTLVDQASSDPLTGLSNRRQIGDEGRRLVESLRPGAHISVLTVDLDGFKALNDRHGHHVGDQALRVVGDELRALTRRHDLVGRLGGDEFVVAQQVRSAEEGIEIAQRVTAELTTRLRATLPQCTLGVTGGLTVGDSNDDDFDDLLNEADHSLIRAKVECKGMMRVADRIVAAAV